MALLFEIGDYYLKGLTDVLQVVFCTNQSRKRGIPGKSDSFKEPIMNKIVCKDINEIGVNPTIYEPKNKFENIVNLKHWKLHG